MRRKSPTELIKEAQRIGAATALPGQTAIPVTGVPDVDKDEPAPVQVNSDMALIYRMADYAVKCIQHRQRRNRLITAAFDHARNLLGQASDQHELDSEILDLVTKDLG